MKRLVAEKGLHDRFMRCAHAEVEKISEDCFACVYCKKLLTRKEVDGIGSEIRKQPEQASLSATDPR